MVLSDAGDDELHRIHLELCNKLNLDSSIVAASWDTFESISKKYALEGEKIHWLGCAIYVASRVTLDNSTVVNGVDLISLLKHSNLSFEQFFFNISSWAEMARLPDEFRNKIDNLRSSFSIAYNTFKKCHPLFTEIFIPPIPNAQDLETSRNRNRRNRIVPCTSLKIFEFIWNLFILMKAEEPSCADELVKSYHLMYCCIDLAFKNARTAERRDLFNNSLAEELVESIQDLRGSTEVPCIVNRFDAVITDALHMKKYTFRRLMKKLIGHKTLIADEHDFTGIFDPKNFDQNFKSVAKAYEEHVIAQGDFDETIFLAEFKRTSLEKEQNGQSWTSMRVLPPGDSADASILESPKVGEGTGYPKGLDTPLTGRRFLGPRESDFSGRSTSENVSRLHSIIGDRSAGPSEHLKRLFESCQRDPLPKIQDILSSMKDRFIEAYTSNNFSIEEAQNRADLGIKLFYKYVEMILNKEKNLTSDISALVEKEIFYQCMFACCLDIVLYCYNFPRKFPWVLEILRVEPVHFVKVIELIVRAKDNLFRELIKHLNRIEETVIGSLIWRSNSPIWDAIEKSGQGIPKFQDTALPGHLLYNDISNEHILQSPGVPSATDCFQSPLSQLCRNLFPSSGPTPPGTHMVVPDSEGTIKLVPIVDGERKTDNQHGSPGARPDPQAAALPRRTGSLSIIFRKFYNLAAVRMQHLCSNLEFEDFELRRKIWTIFEDSIRHTDLIKDRHLDQLLMCAIYVICKAGNITKMPNLFAIIMKHYRKQPQASSSVYRDVLIERGKTNDEREERGDLIQFYNSVYVKVMQTYAVRFQPNSNPSKNVPLSPLPASRKSLVSSNLPVVGNIFVKPMEMSTAQTGSTINYYFSRSPSKDLMNINRAINSNRIQGKRLLIDEDGNMPSNKKLSNRKIQSLVEDRQRQNAPE